MNIKETPLTEKLFELRGDDIYIAGFSVKQYVITNNVTKEQAYDLAKLSSNLAWMRGIRNSFVMGESVTEYDKESYGLFTELLESTPGLVDHMIQYVETYKNNLMKDDPKAWWKQYGKQLLK